MKLFIAILAIFSNFNFARCEVCSNRFENSVVRAAGDWSNLPLWNSAEPFGQMKFDSNFCQYTLSLAGLRPEMVYNWKLVIDGSWSLNFGCNGQNGPDCVFRTNSEGKVRLIARVSNKTPELKSDFLYTSIDYTIPFTCANRFLGKDVRASGNFSQPEWLATEPLGLMQFNKVTCEYSVILRQISPNFSFEWKVTINNGWNENYGCGANLKSNCIARTNDQGSVRLIFRPEKSKLTYDYIFLPPPVDSLLASSTSRTTTQPILLNPMKPCDLKSKCPTCSFNDYFKTKLLRVSGDWSVDAGSTTLWNAAEPKGLLVFNENLCQYECVVEGLKPRFEYKWKMSVGNSWLENYGCDGLFGADCTFITNDLGKIRFLVKFPTSNQAPQLKTDFNNLYI